ncbi:MAG: phosphoribosylglycinamide synthetase C domain-containing protein, partial [Candidatus Aenigmatarchaeota archaeon]
KTRVCIVGASKGYPGDYSRVKGKRIYGLEEAMAVPGVTVYGAGIRMEDGNFYANGGRLFSVVGEGDNIIHAQERARDVMERISVEGDNLYWRNDIGLRDIGRYRKAISIS